MVEELASAGEVHHDVELVVGLEGVVHLDDEGRVQLSKHLTLIHCVFELIHRENVLLAEHLHSKRASC